MCFLKCLVKHLALGGLVLAVLAQNTSAAESRQISFDVYLGENTHIGTHNFSIEKTAAQSYKVVSRSVMRVNILFFTAFSYNHQAEEVWQGGCLQKLESKTIENGEVTQVKGRTEDDAFLWQVDGGNEKSATECVRSFAYWHPTYLLKAERLLNPQTGALKDVTTSARDIEASQTSLADKGHQNLKEISIAGDELDIKVWYNEVFDWQGLASQVDGNRIWYKRVESREIKHEDLF